MTPTTEPAKRLGVLLVGGAAPDRALIGEMLQAACGPWCELECLPADDAAVSVLAAGSEDICLLDCHTDKERGLALLRNVLNTGCRMPVVVLVDGNANGTDDEEWLSAGAADCLSKGKLNPSALRRVVRRAVDHARAIEALKTSEDALRQSEERYRSLIQNAVYGIYHSTIGGRFAEVNRALVAMLGYLSDAELMEVGIENLYADPTERRRLIDRLQSNRIEGIETQWKRKDGSRITVRLSGRVLRSSEGDIDGFEMIVEDVTERRLLESQFRQAQKMEAIGRLAGGIAHDFNNLLTAMLGYSDLLLDQFAESDPSRYDVLEIKKAAERASSLTRQLLAFSRKQVLQPKPLDLNSIVSGFDKMLRRLIGEDVELITALGDDLGRVKADPGQVEQIIMNLAVNARDAMPNGGKLIIETNNVELDAAYARRHEPVIPGRYVVLAVSDTGCGMDDEVKSHLFEPFFSTKERGKGTGLGLATVYGIVKQSGGYIWVYSEPGRGASFKIYLPRIDGTVVDAAGSPRTSGATSGDETVLVVEDEPAVRRLAVEVLRRHGYQVLEAADGGEAMKVAERHPGNIHVLITDLVMPEMNGVDLAGRLIARRPATRVLYISGYTDEAVARGGVLEPGTNFLQKPFNSYRLASTVRQVLDRSLGQGLGARD
jgi:two-component system cell cycle sensor histidine kinase/response regulator CckA